MTVHTAPYAVRNRFDLLSGTRGQYQEQGKMHGGVSLGEGWKEVGMEGWECGGSVIVWRLEGGGDMMGGKGMWWCAMDIKNASKNSWVYQQKSWTYKSSCLLILRIPTRGQFKQFSKFLLPPCCDREGNSLGPAQDNKYSPLLILAENQNSRNSRKSWCWIREFRQLSQHRRADSNQIHTLVHQLRVQFSQTISSHHTLFPNLAPASSAPPTTT